MTKQEQIKKGVEKALTPYILKRQLKARLDELGISSMEYHQLKRTNNMSYKNAMKWIEMFNLDVDLSYIHKLKECGLNPHQISKKLGVKSSTVAEWMNGNKQPRLGVLEKILQL